MLPNEFFRQNILLNTDAVEAFNMLRDEALSRIRSPQSGDRQSFVHFTSGTVDRIYRVAMTKGELTVGGLDLQGGQVAELLLTLKLGSSNARQDIPPQSDDVVAKRVSTRVADELQASIPDDEANYVSLLTSFLSTTYGQLFKKEIKAQLEKINQISSAT